MLPPAYTSSLIFTMAIGEVNGTRQLFIGGWFRRLGADEANYVGSFDGTTWRTLGRGVDDRVWASAIFDDGTGNSLYVGGDFTEADGLPALAVARWDGAAWNPVGEGFTKDNGFDSATVRALLVADVGDGPKLYAGGDFDASGSTALLHVAAWNGTTWEPLGPGLPGGVLGLGVIDVGDGPSLAAAGDGVHIWNGSSWSKFADANGAVNGVAQASHENGAVYVAGLFTEVAGVPSEGIARWGCECAADFNGDGVVDTRDFVAFLNSWAAGNEDADFDGNGVIDIRDFIVFLGVWSVGCS
jgi:hypothetical protein